jgi:hypothetical protein
MQVSRRVFTIALVGVLSEVGLSLSLSANGAEPAAIVQGQDDFDFEFGTWTARLKRLKKPLSGSTEWVELKGVSRVRKVWDGRANLGELRVGNETSQIEGLSLRLFNPETGVWSIHWASSADGTITAPLVGHFADGRGEFYNEDTFDGRPIHVRFIFSDITPNSFRFEQSFSADGKKTWEPNWIATFTRQ